MSETSHSNVIHLDQTYSLRPASGADAEALLRLYNTHSQRYFGRDCERLENLHKQFDADPSVPAENSRVLVSPEGEILALARMFDSHPTPVRPHLNLRLLPEAPRDGVMNMLDWALDRARLCLQRTPQDARVVLETTVHANDHFTIDLLRELGMQPKNQAWQLMKIIFAGETPAPTWPEGFRVLTYPEFKDMQAVQQVVYRSFQDHRNNVPIDNDDKADARWQERIAGTTYSDLSLWYLALKGDELVAACLCNPDSVDYPGHGHIDVVGVLPEYRGMGLSRNLILHAYQEFQRRGMPGANLRVDGSSITRANEIYASLGMHVDVALDTWMLQLRDGRELSRQ